MGATHTVESSRWLDTVGTKKRPRVEHVFFKVAHHELNSPDAVAARMRTFLAERGMTPETHEAQKLDTTIARLKAGVSRCIYTERNGNQGNPRSLRHLEPPSGDVSPLTVIGATIAFLGFGWIVFKILIGIL